MLMNFFFNEEKVGRKEEGRGGDRGWGGLGRRRRRQGGAPHPQHVVYGVSKQKMLHNFCTSPPTQHKYIFQEEMSG